jgi:hypothetical protein
MNRTRRSFMVRVVETLGAATIIAALPRSAQACLYGKWKVRCANGHVDTVTEGTCQHVCEKCGLQAFSGDTVTVVCPEGHLNRVNTGKLLQSFKCTTPRCGKECRIDPVTKPKSEIRERPDHR